MEMESIYDKFISFCQGKKLNNIIYLSIDLDENKTKKMLIKDLPNELLNFKSFQKYILKTNNMIVLFNDNSNWILNKETMLGIYKGNGILILNTNIDVKSKNINKWFEWFKETIDRICGV